MRSALISPAALKALLGSPQLRVLDATYGQPALPVSIGNAVDFDIDAIADTTARQAHTIPSAEDFAAAVTALGIGNDNLVVVYDSTGIAFAAARVWWMFRLFGHDNVKVLDGGLPAWVSAGYPVTEKREEPQASGVAFRAVFRPALFKSKTDILANIDTQDFTVLDARDPMRFSGLAAEPRPGMASGHIPQSKNLPYAQLIDPATGTMKTAAEIAAAVAPTGLDARAKTAVSCGSGVTACVVALALHELGFEDAAIYGGSWSEWAADPAMPKETGTKN